MFNFFKRTKTMSETESETLEIVADTAEAPSGTATPTVKHKAEVAEETELVQQDDVAEMGGEVTEEKDSIDKQTKTEHRAEPSREQRNEAQSSDLKSATDLKSIKVRKRPLESNSGFSLRRGPTTKTETPLPLPTASSKPQKPAWMSQAEYEKLNPSRPASPTGEPPKKLKAPSRRGDSYAPRSQQPQLRDKTSTTQDDEVTRDIAYKKQDLNVSIRQHYNERAWDSKREHRGLSAIIKLRNFNNVIKHILIHESTQNSGVRVLDLGCGKGGDLRKWEQVDPSQYVGIDISNASIMEAARRYRSNRSRFPVVFATGDAFGLPLPEILYEFPEVQFPMDVVTMQFCLHYAFETEAKARQTIENVARSLRPGGVFIGTIPNSDFIGHKIRHMAPGSKSFGNELYSVTFETQPPKTGEFPTPFGNVYNYYLKDAIDNVPEYIIPFETLRAICSDYGLRLKFKEPFHDYFSKKIPSWYERLSPRVKEGIRKDNGGVGVSGQESEATSYFYLAFTFVKAG